jgi:hypothetical protein
MVVTEIAAMLEAGRIMCAMVILNGGFGGGSRGFGGDEGGESVE